VTDGGNDGYLDSVESDRAKRLEERVAELELKIEALASVYNPHQIWSDQDAIAYMKTRVW
jgi:hypothetical protein